MLTKRMPSHLYVFVENNYRHEHVMITKLYIVVVVVFVALRPMSTAMVIAGRSVHITTLFPGQA